MHQRLFRRDLPLRDQLLDIGMVGSPELQSVTAESVEAAIAAMRPADLPRLEKKHDGRAVRILLIDEARRLDQEMRLVEARLEH